MRNGRFVRKLAGFLAALTLLQCGAPLTALAAEQESDQIVAEVQQEVTPELQSGTAIIPNGADEAAVKQALFEALVVNKEGVDPQSLNWEFFGTSKSDPWGGKDESKWVSVLEGGNWTSKVVFVTYKYSVAPLNELGDGTYQVRLVDDNGVVIGDEVTLTKKSGLESSIEVTDDQTVPLTYNDNGTANYDKLRAAIFEAVVTSTTPELDWDDVTIEYWATSRAGTKHDWASLSGETKDVIYVYPSISANESAQKIRISYAGGNGYLPTSAEVNVTITERTAGSIVLKADQNVGVTYKDSSIDYDTLRQSIFDAVVDTENSVPNTLTANDVTIEYYTKAMTDVDAKYVALEGEKGTILTYPAMNLGNGQKIRISWGGNGSYTAASAETTVNIVEGRETPEYTQKTGPYTVSLTVDDNMKVDYNALRKDILNAVVDSEFFTTDNVTIEYYYNGITSVDSKWLPLEGQAIVGGMGYPAISVGDKQIRIHYAGDETYAPTTIEATITVKDREKVQFNLNEGPYEVGLVFTADQGYNYDATAAAIYNTVVASTTNPTGLTAEDVTVEYNVDKTGITDTFKPLNETDLTGLVKFGTGTWEIRISWAGNQEFKGNSVTVEVTTTDSRAASTVALKEGVSFTYNMDVNAMKQAIFDNAIDWENSTLPAKENLSIDNFTIEYKAKLTDAETGLNVDLGGLLEKFPGLGNIINNDTLTQWVPIEGKVYSIGGTVLGQFPQMGAGENQLIRISYNGNAEYRPSDFSEGTVTVNKAKVSVKVNSTNIYADEALPENFITLNPNDKFDLYTIYAGVTSNVTTGIYLDLPARYTDNSLIIKAIDGVLEGLGQKTLTQMMNEGITVGELRALFNTQGVLDALEALGINTGTFGQILTVINKLPGILDSVRIAFGTPNNRAGLYTVGVITDSKNYETGVGIGFLLVKMRLSGANLTWNKTISGGKLTAEEAKTFDFGATLSYNGDVTVDQSGVHYLYSGFTSKWKIYSSTTTPPTEPGRYVVTVCILGGNYMAAPITRSFQITK